MGSPYSWHLEKSSFAASEDTTTIKVPVIVIGAGFAGQWCCWALIKAGIHVIQVSDDFSRVVSPSGQIGLVYTPSDVVGDNQISSFSRLALEAWYEFISAQGWNNDHAHDFFHQWNCLDVDTGGLKFPSGTTGAIHGKKFLDFLEVLTEKESQKNNCSYKKMKSFSVHSWNETEKGVQVHGLPLGDHELKTIDGWAMIIAAGVKTLDLLPSFEGLYRVHGQTLMGRSSINAGEILKKDVYITPPMAPLGLSVLGSSFRFREKKDIEFFVDTEELKKKGRDIDPKFECLQVRTGIRCTSADALPVIGPVPQDGLVDTFKDGLRRHKVFEIPLIPGKDFSQRVWMLSGLGARGVSYGAYSAQLLVKALKSYCWYGETQIIHSGVAQNTSSFRFKWRQARKRKLPSSS